MNTRLKTLLSISFVLIFIIISHYAGWLRLVERSIRSVINPLSAQVYSWTIHTQSATHSFHSVDELQTAYEQLVRQYEDQQVDIATVQRLTRDNAELEQQLSFLNTSTTLSHIGAHVIGKNIDQLGRSVLINRGSFDGIALDDPVIVGTGILIGLVSHVEEFSATVRLVDDNQSRIAATILNQDASIGLIEGGFGISVQMNFIPQNEEIHVGDTIVTSGLTRNIPRGLLIGTVEALEREAYQPFQRAIIAPATDLDKIFLVSVLSTSP